MSKLKAYQIYTRRDEGAWGYNPFAEPTDVELNDEQVYLKSEADLYIAHQKYKRCLAMAAQYEYKSRYYDLLVKVEASYLLSNPHNVHKYERKAFRSKILRARWRELAEHYKEMAK